MKNNLNLRAKLKCKELFSLNRASFKRLGLKFIKNLFASKKKGPSPCLPLRHFVFTQRRARNTRDW